MASKINGIDGTPIASVGPGRAVKRAQDPATGSASSDPAEEAKSVQITGSARTLAHLEQTLRDLPAIDEVRVAQISSALEQGTYTVRPDHIADQLLNLEHALGTLREESDPQAPIAGNKDPGTGNRGQ